MGTFIVGAVVLAAVILAAYRIYKDKKSGKGCGGNCGNCMGGDGSSCGKCH